SSVHPPALHSFPTRRSSDLSAFPSRASSFQRAFTSTTRPGQPGTGSMQPAVTPTTFSYLPLAVLRACTGSRTGWEGRLAPFKSRSEEHTSELQSRENLVCRL